jgi:hypothetical protein
MKFSDAEEKLLSILERHVFDRKGSLSFNYDYHSSSWVGVRTYKDGSFVSTIDMVEGEGQGSLALAAKELLDKLGVK